MHNKAIEQHHINQGGFRKSFPTFTNHLENFYDMSFVNDTGRSFAYSKDMNDTNGNEGQLIVGVKLDMREELILFSKFKSKYKGEFLGIDVAGVNYHNIETIDKGINVSIDKIKTQGIIAYNDNVSKLINHSVSKQFIEEWNTLNKKLSNTDMSDELDVFTNNFYIPDLVSVQKFIENFDILNNSWKGMKEGYGTISIKDIFYIPPGFTKFFIAAYPDVYQWYQENAQKGKVEIMNKLEKLSDEEAQEYFSHPQRMIEFYRSLINQFKKEGNQLETKK